MAGETHYLGSTTTKGGHSVRAGLMGLSRAGSHDDPSLAGMSTQERKNALKAKAKKSAWEAKMLEWEA